MAIRSLTQRCLAAVVVFTLAVTGFAWAVVPVADAQTPVVGTADFRKAPQLVPGTYSDRLVTGDTAWYSLVYTNETPYDFKVAIAGNPPVGVSLTASFVAPTLTTVDGPAESVSGPGVVYPAGHTNLWFLKVSLESSGQAGVEYPITLTIEGVQTLGVDDCEDTPGCSTLEAEYNELQSSLSEAETELEAIGSLETEAAVSSEIENLRGFADTAATLLPGIEGRLAQNEAAMARLCAPDPMCETFPDPAPKTPLIGWLVGLAALIFGAYTAVKKLSDESELDMDSDKQTRAPSAIEKARREAAVKKKADKKASKKKR